MCGIALLWDERLPERARSQAVDTLAEALRHRGPDDHGVWSTPEMPVAVAQRRLAIQGLGAQGHQPMEAPAGRGALVFNGELFEIAPLRRELSEAGAVFHGESDTEVLLQALLHWGMAGTLARIRGQFAFVWVDRRARRVFFARDRLGIRPLYYAEQGGRLAVASEQKGLLPLAWVDRTPVLSAALRFLALGRTDDVPFETMVRGIQSLPPGHWAEWDGTQLTVQRYFRVEVQPGSSTIAAVRANLERAVAGQLVGEVPIGAMVSGGLDSSTVTLLADRARVHAGTREPLHLFAYHDRVAEQDERSYQRAVLESVRSPHVVHWVSSSPEELAADFERYVHHQEEPYGDASSYAEYCVAREASRHGVKVMLSGLGGDEVFVGYPTFFGPLVLDTLGSADVPALLSLLRAAPGVLARGPGAVATPVAAAAYHALPARLRNAVTAFRSAHARQVGTRMAFFAAGAAWRTWHTHDGAGATNAALRGALESWCVPRYLAHSDRMGLAHGVEGRFPLLDEGVIEAAFGIPPADRVGTTGLKVILRFAVADVLPALVRDRAWKLGFHAPLGAYVRGIDGPLRAGHQTVRELLGTAPAWDSLEVGARWVWGNLGTYLQWVSRQPVMVESRA
jgi:asparagine synthase (glutamine-hydrolysing)